MPHTTPHPPRTPAEEAAFARKLLQDHIEQQHAQQLTPAEMLEGRRRAGLGRMDWQPCCATGRKGFDYSAS